MSEYELVKKLGSYDNFKGLKSMAKVPRHKLFAWNKLSAPTVSSTQISVFCSDYDVSRSQGDVGSSKVVINPNQIGLFEKRPRKF
jgi:hypothetical protein